MRGEVEAARSINDLPLRHREVGEDGEGGEVDLRAQGRYRSEPELNQRKSAVLRPYQSHSLVLGSGSDGQDLRGGVKGQRRRRGQQVHHCFQRPRIGRV